MPDDAYIGGRSENNIKCVVHDISGFSQFYGCGIYSVLSRSYLDYSYYIMAPYGRNIRGAGHV